MRVWIQRSMSGRAASKTVPLTSLQQRPGHDTRPALIHHPVVGCGERVEWTVHSHGQVIWAGINGKPPTRVVLGERALYQWHRAAGRAVQRLRQRDLRLGYTQAPTADGVRVRIYDGYHNLSATVAAHRQDELKIIRLCRQIVNSLVLDEIIEQIPDILRDLL